MLTAAENVEYPLVQRTDISRAERRKRVEHFLRMVGLERFAGHRPNQLSGGQRQRVAIARALAIGPSLVLADEPTANLDRKTGDDILRLMKSINSRMGTTFVFSTHDPHVIQMVDHLIRIEDGTIRKLSVRAGDRWRTVNERHSPDAVDAKAEP